MGITEPVARLIRRLETNTQESRSEMKTGERTKGPTAKDFEAVLYVLFASAWRQGLDHIDVEAGPLHRQVGGYPGSANRMPLCCSVMRKAMHPGDRILQQPPKGDGATVRIRYFAKRNG